MLLTNCKWFVNANHFMLRLYAVIFLVMINLFMGERFFDPVNLYGNDGIPLFFMRFQ